MEHLPLDILGQICFNLKISDMLAIATANKYFRSVFLKDSLRDQIVDLLVFPRKLELVTLKYFESMSLNERLEEASEMGDKIVVEGLIKMGADNYERAMRKAILRGRDEVLEILMKSNLVLFPKVNCLEMGCVALMMQNYKMVKNIYEIAKQFNIICDSDSMAIYACKNGNFPAIDSIIRLNNLKNIDSMFKLKNVTYSDMCNAAVQSGRAEIVMKIISLLVQFEDKI